MKNNLWYFIVVLLLSVFFLVSCGKDPITLSLNGQDDIMIELNSTYQDSGVNIEDSKVEGTVDTSREGSYTLTYSYEDQSITRTVHVVDPNRIITTLNGSEETYVKEGDPYIESGCHVLDRIDGNLTSEVEISGEVDTNTPGDYSILYQVTNSAGYTSKTTRTVHVVKKSEFKSTKSGVPVLMYHFVYSKGDVPKVWDNNYIKDTDLEKQLEYLQSEHYYYPSWAELRAYIDGKISLPEKSVILTFDDGRKEFLKHGIPVLEKYEVPATSFVIAKSNGSKKIKKYASPYVSFQSHSYGMHTGGSGIGHGGIIFTMSKDEIVKDLKKCQKIVQNTEAFAYPYGDVSENGIAAVEKAGFLCAFNTHYGKVKPGDNPYNLTRVRICGDYTLAQFKALVK